MAVEAKKLVDRGYMAAQVFEKAPAAVHVLEPIYTSGDAKRGSHERSTSFKVCMANEAGAALLGIETEESANVEDHGFFSSEFKKHCRQVMYTQEVQTFDICVGEVGLQRYFQVIMSAWSSRLIVTYNDISARVEQEGVLRDAGFRDPLTGVFNRRHFKERANELISLATREGWNVGLLYLDLNDFKKVNDTYGHTTGDRILLELVKRLSSVVRAEDVLFRIGGDEFGIFLAHTSGKKASAMIARIYESVREPVRLSNGEDYEIAVTVGATVRAASDACPDALLDDADRAMYRGKRA